MSTITHLCVRSTIGETTRDHDIKEVFADHMMTRQVQMRSPLEEAFLLLFFFFCCMCVHTGKLPYHKHLSVVVTNLFAAFFPIYSSADNYPRIHVPVMWCWINSPLASPMFHMAKCTVGAHTECFFSASSAPVFFRYEWFFSASSAPAFWVFSKF